MSYRIPAGLSEQYRLMFLLEELAIPTTNYKDLPSIDYGRL